MTETFAFRWIVDGRWRCPGKAGLQWRRLLAEKQIATFQCKGIKAAWDLTSAEPELAFGRTQPGSDWGPTRKFHYFGPDRVEKSLIRPYTGS